MVLNIVLATTIYLAEPIMYIIPKPPLLVVAYMRLAFDQNVRDIYGLKNAGRGLHFSAFITAG